VTHHLPGQLVAYPVLALQRHGGDLHLYLRALEAAVLEVLTSLGLRGELQEGLTGVWLEGRKVAAIGVGARRWISQHGLALNVSCPLGGFGAIVPWCPGLTIATVQPLLRQALARRFGLELRPPKPTEWPWR
jgi:lipoyl(octanoyl) transferase